MSLVRSAQLNGLNPHAYLKDILQRLPTQRDSAIGELLPHRWKRQAPDAPAPSLKTGSPAAYGA